MAPFVKLCVFFASLTVIAALVTQRYYPDTTICRVTWFVALAIEFFNIVVIVALPSRNQ